MEERRTNTGRRTLDEATDATRRTRLANERTYLAWLRTGLTALAVGIGAGKLVPGLSDTGSTWGYQALGVGFVLLGMICIGYSMRRQDDVERALASGRFAPPDHRVIFALTVIGLLLGLGMAILIASGS